MFSKMEKIVLSYSKLKERIESRTEPEKERERALQNLEEIRAEFSPTTIKGVQKFLDQSLLKLYDGINFDDSLANVKELLKDNCVVLTPNHQSHADYLAINYKFYSVYKMPLYVAGGKNLNIFPIGKVFRKSGCFFIRRSFNSDINYKLTLEGYLFYLLKMGRPIEFFFEGGRSRTGKLLSPRFGLFSMLLDAHRELQKHVDKKLIFIPVSIVHEYVPETKSLARELEGKAKKKESTRQLFGLVKLLAYQFGHVNICMGKPVSTPQMIPEDHKQLTQELAFKCFREVGKNMMLTPTSLLAMILLDEPSGALVWQDIILKAHQITDYCLTFKVPMTESLKESLIEASLERAMDILIGNERVDVIGREHHGSLYYSIKENCRSEILYSKNTILHHFLVPSIISDAWVNLFRGQIKTLEDLKQFFLSKRAQLKHEFYLPTVGNFFYRTLKIVSHSIGRRVSSLEGLLELNNQEVYQLVSKIAPFSRGLSYIYESYYASALALKELDSKYESGFKTELYNKRTKEVHENERKIGRLIRYPESYSIPMVRSALKYYEHEGYITREDGHLKIADPVVFDKLLQSLERDLIDKLTLNFRPH